MKDYYELLDKVLKKGTDSDDRTGTGTVSLFGAQMRFDISKKGFPLLTGKQTSFKMIATELLWMLSGNVNTKVLNEQGNHIWDEWADKNGNVGPIYGHNWRSWGAKAFNRPQPMPNCEGKANYLGVADGRGKKDHPLKKTWEGMVARCYDEKSVSYERYGKRGVFVCNRWLEFKNFADDAVAIPGWNEKILSDKRYVLDKDGLGGGFEYGPDSCQWITDKENMQLGVDKIYTVKKDGREYRFTNISDFCEENGCEPKNFSDLWTGNKSAKKRNGFSLVSVEPINRTIDQIQNVIDRLKTDPMSRRHIVSAWNVADVESGEMALPPCHVMFQFYARKLSDQERIAMADANPEWRALNFNDFDGLVPEYALSCQLYQRSADLFLGVPYNIASYSLLTRMIAQLTNMVTEEFIWTGGDCHIYKNHISQVKKLLYRYNNNKIPPLPRLELNEKIDSIDDFTLDDMKVIDYHPLPAIKAPIAV